MITPAEYKIIELSAIPPDTWQEFSNAVKRSGGMNKALWRAYSVLPILFSMSPMEVTAYFQERAGTCKTL